MEFFDAFVEFRKAYEKHPVFQHKKTEGGDSVVIRKFGKSGTYVFYSDYAIKFVFPDADNEQVKFEFLYIESRLKVLAQLVETVELVETPIWVEGGGFILDL